jgi:Tfp pilus assembly protein PilF
VSARQAASRDISGYFVTAPQNALPKDLRLDSWKAIAAFFGKDERTVKRWEKERGLPVRRLPGAARGTVFAYTSELERWLAGSPNTSGPLPLGNIPVAEKPPEPEQAPVTSSVVVKAAPIVVTETHERELQVPTPAAWVRVLLWTIPLAVLAGFLIYSSIGHHEIHFNRALAARHQPDATAQDLYLKGRFYFEKRTPADLNTAVDAFTQAIVHDPAYAQAYVGLADSYSLLREFSTMPTLEAEQRARAAAQKAVELDPNLAEAHTSLAFAEFWGFLNAAKAEHEFRRAIELDPNLARAHHWYATFLVQILRFDDALAEIERARQLDPSSKAILADKGVLLLDAGRTDDAFALLKQMEAADPNFRSAHQYLAAVYWEQANYEAALAEFKKEAILRGNDDAVKQVEAQQTALRTGGIQGLFQFRLATALQSYEHENGSAFAVAVVYGHLQKREEALKYLELARQQHDIGLTDVEFAPELRWLHSDPEFRKLVTDIGMPALP